MATQAGWRRPSVGADDEKGAEFHPLGPLTLQTYDAVTGEPLLAGRDFDGDNQLTPGSDAISRGERRIESQGGDWWEITRQWRLPLTRAGEEVLLSEQRQRLTGLGRPHPDDPALGVLVSETLQIQPPATEDADRQPENLVTRRAIHRHRESGHETRLTSTPSGVTTRETIAGGLLLEVAEIRSLPGGAEELCCEYRFEYDAFGRRVAMNDPRTGASRTVYDPASGRVTAEVDPGGRTTRYAYYGPAHPAAGRLALTVVPDGKEQRVAYTARGEQRATWGDSVQPLVYEYNDYGERTALRTFQTLPDGDPGDQEDLSARTAWHYDEPTGLLLRKEYADGHGPAYTYTPAGQLAERRWARESATPTTPTTSPDPANADIPRAPAPSRVATRYAYDPATLQLTAALATDGSEVRYEHDPEGRLLRVTDSTGTRSFRYDGQDRIMQESVALSPRPGADPIRYEIHRTYTKLGQPESVHLVSAEGETRPLDHRIDYQWNEHGRLSWVKSLAGEFSYRYNEANPALLTKMTGPAHSVETTYEPHRDLITGITNRSLVSRDPASAADAVLNSSPTDSFPSPISTYAYHNDLLGRRETIAQGGSAFAGMSLGQNTVEVAYNDRSEVIGAIYRSGEETLQRFTYEYDAIGNRRRTQSSGTNEAATLTYETNALNQYTAIQTALGNEPRSKHQDPTSNPQDPGSPSHDLDGNLLEDRKHRYTWNANNRLIRVESKDGKTRIEYQYDHQGRRTTRATVTDPGTERETKKTDYYVYDGWNLLAQLSSENTDHQSLTTEYFTFGRDLSGSLQGAGGVGGLLAISKRGDHRYPAYDANGNVGQLLDGQGEVVASYTYDPFGNVTEMAGEEAAENPWRFSTKPVEEVTGWSYYGYRWYDAELGRWVNRDPIEERGGVNLYGFVGNDGIGSIDILGKYKSRRDQQMGNGPYTIHVKTCQIAILAGHGWDRGPSKKDPTKLAVMIHRFDFEDEVIGDGEITSAAAYAGCYASQTNNGIPSGYLLPDAPTNTGCILGGSFGTQLAKDIATLTASAKRLGPSFCRTPKRCCEKIEIIIFWSTGGLKKFGDPYSGEAPNPNGYEYDCKEKTWGQRQYGW